MAIKSRNKVSVAFSMASMTDLVFLLLIFFIIVSTLVSPYGLNVNLPKSANKTSEKANVTVSIDANLLYAVNSKQVAPETIEGVLQQKLIGQEKPQFILKVDESVPTGLSVKILDIANRNKFGVVLATQPK